MDSGTTTRQTYRVLLGLLVFGAFIASATGVFGQIPAAARVFIVSGIFLGDMLLVLGAVKPELEHMPSRDRRLLKGLLAISVVGFLLLGGMRFFLGDTVDLKSVEDLRAIVFPVAMGGLILFVVILVRAARKASKSF